MNNLYFSPNFDPVNQNGKADAKLGYNSMFYFFYFRIMVSLQAIVKLMDAHKDVGSMCLWLLKTFFFFMDIVMPSDTKNLTPFVL